MTEYKIVVVGAGRVGLFLYIIVELFFYEFGDFVYFEREKFIGDKIF